MSTRIKRRAAVISRCIETLENRVMLAATLGMPLTTVAEYIRSMDARRHVRRVAHPRDGRSYVLVLTAEGLRAHREANRSFFIRSVMSISAPAVM